jgi:hypothetical protein
MPAIRHQDSVTYTPDSNGAYQIRGWDIQQTGAGDWRCSIIDEDGNYLENEYFDKFVQAVRHALQNPQSSKEFD